MLHQLTLTSDVRKYNYFKANYQTVNIKLQNIDWHRQMEGKNTDEMWECIAEKINKIVEVEHTGVQNKPIKSSDNTMDEQAST